MEGIVACLGGAVYVVGMEWRVEGIGLMEVPVRGLGVACVLDPRWLR